LVGHLNHERAFLRALKFLMMNDDTIKLGLIPSFFFQQDDENCYGIHNFH
jgi:hypothetical protein